jgi:iron complex transport system permease protein
VTHLATARTEGGHLRVGDLHLMQQRRHQIVILGLAVLLFFAALAALAIGPVPIGLGDALSALWPFGGGLDQGAQGEIIRSIRLPRSVLGVCAGAALGLSGAVLQVLFRNPLADPGIIGVSSGAALAAGCVIVVGHEWAPSSFALAGPYALPVGAFLGSLVALLAVYALGRSAGMVTGAALILAGIAVNATAMSALGFLSFISTDEQLRQLTFWTLGSLSRATWTTLIPPAIAMALSAIMMLRLALPLNVYMLGDREAGHLGVDVERLKRSAIILASIAGGAAVAVCGMIGFVGLAAPHLVRICAGADNRLVLPASGLLGAILLLLADLIARTAVAPAELPIGVLTGILGGPFFLWLLARQRGSFL